MNICYICCIHNFGFDLSVIISTNLVQNEISNIFKTLIISQACLVEIGGIHNIHNRVSDLGWIVGSKYHIFPIWGTWCFMAHAFLQIMYRNFYSDEFQNCNNCMPQLFVRDMDVMDVVLCVQYYSRRGHFATSTKDLEFKNYVPL